MTPFRRVMRKPTVNVSRASFGLVRSDSKPQVVACTALGVFFLVMDMSQALNTNQGFAEARLPTKERDSTYHLASEYLNRGWSVIPLSGKRPALASWRRLQTNRASPQQLGEWFGGHSPAHVGIVTGKLSGLVVVDCDTPQDAEFWQQQFPKTPLIVRTGGGGAHFYYRYPDGDHVGNRAKLLARRIDLRGEGGYVVAPPSQHSNGTCYAWLSGADYALDWVPTFSPEWIAEKKPAEAGPDCGRDVKNPRSYIRRIRAISGQCGHGQTFRAACVLRDAGLSPEEALCELLLWNEKNASPPWTPGVR